MTSETKNTGIEPSQPEGLAEVMQEKAGSEASSATLPQVAMDKEDTEKVNQILAMKLPVIVKIAEKRMTISEILKLAHGSLIQFEKGAYQHFDLMVNNSTIGLGQPVKIGEQFGVKITHIGDITDTIRSMGETVEP